MCRRWGLEFYGIRSFYQLLANQHYFDYVHKCVVTHML